MSAVLSGPYQSQFSSFQQTEQQTIQQQTPSGAMAPTFEEGSVGDLLTSAHAQVADMLGQQIYTAQQAAYVTTATGAYLDAKAADYGIQRKPAVAASSTSFSFNKNQAATQNIVIPAGSSILTPPGVIVPQVEFTTTAAVTLATGQASVPAGAVCLTAGSIGNLTAGTQLVLGSAIPGIDGVTLTANITNGIDQESDSALRTRVLNALQGESVGTAAWYIAQATSIDGVSSAAVVGGYNGQLNGVGVYCVGPGNAKVSSSTLTQVQTLLNGVKPMTDSPTALQPTFLGPTISLTATLATGVDSAAATSAIQTAVAAYVNAMGIGAPATSGNLYPSDIVTTAKAVAGVVDIGNVQINGSGSALAISASEVPQIAYPAVAITVAIA